MDKYTSLKNILNSILKGIKKQDFLVYFRKISNELPCSLLIGSLF